MCKKKLFTILIVFLAIKTYSQSGSQSYYKRLFDTRGLDQWDGNSTSPDQLEFAWAVPAHMEALVLMYEKTLEQKYFDTHTNRVQHAGHVDHAQHQHIPDMSKNDKKTWCFNISSR